MLHNLTKRSEIRKQRKTVTKTLTFVHTAPINVATFGRLLTEIDPTIPVKHILDESLLRDARATGITPELAARIQRTLTDAAQGNDEDEASAVVVCTCSTIGGCAEQTVLANGQAVLRVDRTMAEQAVALGSRIVVAAALASTLAPTSELILEVAAQQGREVSIHTLLCEGAWSYFERGDQAGYVAEIAATLHRADFLGDVIVLAQASMADAAPLCADLPVPILSSPRLGAEAAVRAYRSVSE
jgi:hypothetical protein